MKLRESTTAKIAAIILSYIMAITVVITAVGTYIMGYYKFYFSNPETVSQEVLTDMAQREVNFAANTLYHRGSNLKTYYADKNVFYEVIDAETNEITDTNFNGEEYLITTSTNYYEYEDVFHEDKNGNQWYTANEIHRATVKLYIAKNMTKNDLFSVTAKIIEIGFKLRFVAVFIFLASVIFLIALLCYLYCAAGHTKGGEIKRNYLDLLPFDIFTAIVATIGIFSVITVDGLAWDLTSAIIWITIVGSIDYFVALGYTLSFATRVKTGTLIKNNLIYMVFHFFGKRFKKLNAGIKFIYSNASLIKKTLLITGAFAFLEILLCIFALEFYSVFNHAENMLIILIFVNILFIGAALYFAIILQKIKQGGERIAGGDLQYKIETDYMFGSFKEFSLSLNNINEGLQTAVEEKMRSERFKTELITNVSHDIKTPLTSIINYVDLIKKEKIENETVKEYLDVLDRQSGRLKKLVEDLVEASKASTGNLTVNLAVCDLSVLLNQAFGEFDEKLRKANLHPVLKTSGKSVKIMADGRHLWRVFDNLLNNIRKYSQPDTRVYIDLKEADGKAVIVFRNISRYELNVSSEELMERFVRGDSSRNTEGSGLGLSIAKSLVELQGGEMSLSVDGDLFKVTVSFPIQDA